MSKLENEWALLQYRNKYGVIKGTPAFEELQAPL